MLSGEGGPSTAGSRRSAKFWLRYWPKTELEGRGREEGSGGDVGADVALLLLLRRASLSTEKAGRGGGPVHIVGDILNVLVQAWA